MSNKNPFKIITTPNTKTFSFEISAAGKFTIDWGDNNIETIEKTDTNSQIISYKYDRIGKYIIKLDGKATGYNKETSAIIFKNNKNLEKIDGSLGMIFSTLPNCEQPIFLNTFAYCYNLAGNIPEKLFAGIKGAPAVHMFNNTFSGCSELTGAIPEKLFAGIKGAPTDSLFAGTFAHCQKMTGNIPEKLFAGIKGAPANYMFSNTFYQCSKLTGAIPDKLFAGIKGAPADYMFNKTFYQCSKLTGAIPDKLFAGIKGAPADSMFSDTFCRCSELNGAIPEKLFAGIKGAPKQHMFFCTFFACSNLAGSIPKKIFTGISGKPAQDAFHGTFFGCSTMSGTMNEHGIITDTESPEPTEKTPLKSIPVADTTMNTLNKIDVIISGIAPDDLAKIIQSVQKVSNDINIKIAKQVQETNQKQH